MTTARPSGKSVKCVMTKNYASQVNYLIEKIAEIHKKGVPYNQIALLFRALKGNREEIKSTNKLMAKLAKASIPYEVRGGISFFEKSHIKDVFVLLEYRYNPKDVFAKENWIRIVDRYVVGLGKVNSEKIYEMVIKNAKNPILILKEEGLLRRKLDSLNKRKRFLALSLLVYMIAASFFFFP